MRKLRANPLYRAKERQKEKEYESALDYAYVKKLKRVYKDEKRSGF